MAPQVFACTIAKNREEWLAKRITLLKREKELNRLRDELAVERRQLPWVLVNKDYSFTDTNGTVSLSGLFDGKSQLLVYHFMFGPDWDEGCPGCSFWADSFNGVTTHLLHRDVRLVSVSHAPYPKLAAFKKRMGWSFPWYSSNGCDFNFDYHVSFTSEQQRVGAEYNFTLDPKPEEEMPGISVFAKDETGRVYHTYSTYARGLDPINSGYQLLDLVPRGRDEAEFEEAWQWLNYHDAYEGSRK